MPSASEPARRSPAEALLRRTLAAASFGLALWLTAIVTFGFVEDLGRDVARLSAVYAWSALAAYWVSRQCSPAPSRDALWLGSRFRWTFAVALVGFVGFWAARGALHDLLIGVLRVTPHSSYFSVAAERPANELRCVWLALLVLVPPFFVAEAWSLVCGCLGREDARRFTVPVGLASGAAAVGSLCLVTAVANDTWSWLAQFVS
jgi:hypothetical protein